MITELYMGFLAVVFGVIWLFWWGGLLGLIAQKLNCETDVLFFRSWKGFFLSLSIPLLLTAWPITAFYFAEWGEPAVKYYKIQRAEKVDNRPLFFFLDEKNRFYYLGDIGDNTLVEVRIWQTWSCGLCFWESNRKLVKNDRKTS